MISTLALAALAACAQEVRFAANDGKSAAAEFSADALKSLAVTFAIPKLAREGGYDVIRFCLDDGEGNADFVEYPKAGFLNRFKDAAEATYAVLRADGKAGDFGMSAGELIVGHQLHGLRSVKLRASIVIHIKTGEEKIWDDVARKWIPRPIYDEGQELCAGSCTLALSDRIAHPDLPFSVRLGASMRGHIIRRKDYDEKCGTVAVGGFGFNVPMGKIGRAEVGYGGMKLLALQNDPLGAAPLDFAKADLSKWMCAGAACGGGEVGATSSSRASSRTRR